MKRPQGITPSMFNKDLLLNFALGVGFLEESSPDSLRNRPAGFLRPPQLSRAKQSKAKQNKAKLGKAEQSKAKQSKQSKAKQSKAEQSKAKQSKAKPSKAKQSKAQQSKAKQSKAKPRKKKIPSWGHAGIILDWGVGTR